MKADAMIYVDGRGAYRTEKEVMGDIEAEYFAPNETRKYTRYKFKTTIKGIDLQAFIAKSKDKGFVYIDVATGDDTLMSAMDKKDFLSAVKMDVSLQKDPFLVYGDAQKVQFKKITKIEMKVLK